MCREPRARRSPEHGHRLPATLVGCLTLILALSIVVRESRPSVRALGLLALLAIVLQGILGGVTVLYKLPLAVSVAHACLGQTFLLGALVRHTGIPDFPLAFGRVVPPLVSPYITVHFAHRIGALVVAASVMATPAVAGRCHRGDGRLERPALLALALLVLQITLGGVTVWNRRAVLATTTHLVVGAALLATSLTLTLRASRLIGWRGLARAPAGLGRQALL